MRTSLPEKRASLPSPVIIAFSWPNIRKWAVVCEGSLEPDCEGATRSQQKGRSWDPPWEAEYDLLSSSLVTGTVAASISDKRGNGLGAREGALNMGESCNNFHPDSECKLRGPASLASPQCPAPSNAQAGLSDAPQGSLSLATQQSQGTG